MRQRPFTWSKWLKAPPWVKAKDRSQAVDRAYKQLLFEADLEGKSHEVFVIVTPPTMPEKCANVRVQLHDISPREMLESLSDEAVGEPIELKDHPRGIPSPKYGSYLGASKYGERTT